MSFIKYRLPALLWMGVIFWMSTESFSAPQTSSLIGSILYFLFPGMSPQTLDIVNGLLRKAGHLTEYFILGLLLFRAFRRDAEDRWRRRWAVYAFFIVIMYAAADEFHQSFVPSRTASALDVLIDVAGGGLSQALLYLRHRLRR